MKNSIIRVLEEISANPIITASIGVVLLLFATAFFVFAKTRKKKSTPKSKPSAGILNEQAAGNGKYKPLHTSPQAGKEKKKAGQRKDKEFTAKRRKLHFIDEIMPIVAWNEEINCGIMSDGSYIGFLEIVTKNLEYAGASEVEFDMFNWERLYSTFANDIKILAFNFPTDTSKQLAYYKRIGDRTTNPNFRDSIDFMESICTHIATNNTNREFFLCFYAKDLDEYVSLSSQIFATLGGSKRPMIHTIDKEKNQLIIKKLNNMVRKGLQ